jgi:hypothetical protein
MTLNGVGLGKYFSYFLMKMSKPSLDFCLKCKKNIYKKINSPYTVRDVWRGGGGMLRGKREIEGTKETENKYPRCSYIGLTSD